MIVFSHLIGRTSASGIDALRCIRTTLDVLPTKLDCQYCEAKRILSETPGFCCSNVQIVLQQNKLLDVLIQFDMRKIDEPASFRIYVRTYNHTFASQLLEFNMTKNYSEDQMESILSKFKDKHIMLLMILFHMEDLACFRNSTSMIYVTTPPSPRAYSKG